MPDLSLFNPSYLFMELRGQRLQNFVSARSFLDRAGFEAQTPSIHPLGQLRSCGSDEGRGSGQRWMTLDEMLYVDTDRDGIITSVTEVRAKR